MARLPDDIAAGRCHTMEEVLAMIERMRLEGKEPVQ
jgi:hypothetical protein